jgi:5'-nucleotidase
MLKNKKTISMLLALSLTAGIGSYVNVFAEDSKTITIIHTNDVHGRAQGDDKELIGYPKLKTFYDETKAKNPNTLLVDAGDTVHGTTFANISEGKNMVELMNEIGFTVSVPGNHDFNYGFDKLLELAKSSKFKYICANVINKSDKSLAFTPNIIEEVDGVKIGFFGLATPETRYKSSPKNTATVEFTDYIETAKKQVEDLKKQGATVIVAVTHLGIDMSSEERSDILAEKVEGIDLIIDGHSHTLLENGKKVGNTTIAQTGEYLKNIGKVDLTVKDGKVEKIDASVVKYEQAKSIKPDEKIVELIKKAEEKNKPILEKKVGTSQTELIGVREKVRVEETNLGDLVTDAMKASVSSDIAITNGGGIRSSIAKGDVKMGDVLTAFPFSNIVVGLEVKGSVVKSALEHGVDKTPEPDGKFPHISGIEFTLDTSKPAGKRVSNVMINGEALDENKTYKLATNDFLAIGGDDYKMFVGAKKYAENGLLSDVLVDFFKANNNTVNYPDNKLRIKKPGDSVEKTTEPEKNDETPNSNNNGVSLTAHKIVVNNKAVTLNGYVIKDKKYFRIRDIATAFKDSDSPFNVSYDKKTKSISLTSNQKYSAITHDVLVELPENPDIKESSQKVLINKIQDNTLKVYMVLGSNFFPLEDLITILNLDVK